MRLRALAAALLLALPAALASAAESDSGADVEETSSAADDEHADGRSANDPWEPFNRKVFAFNEALDRYALEPVATGWDTVMPHRVELCVENFFDNLLLPTRFANDLLQLKPWEAYETLWRAVVNTTVGLGGLFDPASAWQIHKSDEDFGQTLGYWGTPPGPYLVLPLLGPSNPRDTAGMVVDSMAYVPPYFVPILGDGGRTRRRHREQPRAGAARRCARSARRPSTGTRRCAAPSRSTARIACAIAPTRRPRRGGR